MLWWPGEESKSRTDSLPQKDYRRNVDGAGEGKGVGIFLDCLCACNAIVQKHLGIENKSSRPFSYIIVTPCNQRFPLGINHKSVLHFHGNGDGHITAYAT